MQQRKPVKTIDQYIRQFPEDTQVLLQQVRKAVKEAAPGAEETISYMIPTFKIHGRYLVYFAAYKNHIGFYPMPSGRTAFAKELAKYKSGKGSAQFPVDKPMPISLIKKIVKFRAKENLERLKK